jgi:hypothetical protein
MPISDDNTSDPLASAEAALIQARLSLLARAHELEKAITILRSIRTEPRYVQGEPIPLARPDQYLGYDLSSAFERYMKDRRGFKIPLERVAEDLRIAGVEMTTPGSKNKPVQNLKITIRNRPSVFAFQEDTKEPVKKKRKWTVWLAPTADLPPKKRNRGKKSETQNS